MYVLHYKTFQVRPEIKRAFASDGEVFNHLDIAAILFVT